MPEAARLTLVHVSLAVPLCIVVLMAARARAFELARRAWADERERRGPLARSRRFAAAAAKLVRSLPEEPAVITALVLVSLQVWNDFVVGIFFSGPGATPLAVLLHGQARQFVTNSGPLAAGSVVALAAPVALLAACHRRLIDGLVGGASARAPSTGARLEASLP
jgi:alpha-glucoside transport system permease protein